jgi:uncharacterized protein (DUF2336 family)
MPPSQPLIPELEDILRQVPPAKRVDIFIRIIDLFLSAAERYRPEHVDVFEDVLGRIIAAADRGIRVQMSQRLAPLASAPPGAVAQLARDDSIAIAEPILLQFARLDPSVLIEVVRTKSQEHRLAIACRRQIQPEVTDALLESGDDVVIRYLAGNAGAAFSPEGFNSVVERAKDDGALAEQLKHRRDLPANLKKSLEGRAGVAA